MIAPNMVGHGQSLGVYSASNRYGSHQNLNSYFSASNQNLNRLHTTAPQNHTGHGRSSSRSSNVITRSLLSIDQIESNKTSQSRKVSLEMNQSMERVELAMPVNVNTHKIIENSNDSINSVENEGSHCCNKFVSFWSCSQPCGNFNNSILAW